MAGDTNSSPSAADDPIQDLEKSEKAVAYPKSVFFIVANEFCERFSYYGLRTILVIYLNYVLGYSKDMSTVIYHTFVMFAYFFPIVGGIMADSWLGKYKTILYLSIVYAVGNFIVAITSITDLGIPQKELTIIGLLLVSFGTGGIKPCTSAFGGDQFVLPQQEVQLQKFFSIFYFSINAGSFISTFLTPVLREDVHCFGEDSCYFSAFGVPSVLMVVSIVAFVLGSKWYKITPPGGNVVVEVSKCIWHAATKSNATKREHWLDKADDKYEKEFIEGVKAVLKVLVLYIPLPLFWALFDQQGSRWTFQASRMSGDMGGGVVIKPDQMQVANPIMILLFVPMFETIIYPLLNKWNLLTRPLQRLTVGGLFAAVAFLISAGVQFEIESTYPVLPEADFGQIRIYNGLGYDSTIKVGSYGSSPLGNLGKWQKLDIPVKGAQSDIDFTWTDNLGQEIKSTLAAYNEEATSYVLRVNNETLLVSRKDDVDKSEDGNPTVMLIYTSLLDPIALGVNISFYSDPEKLEYSVLLNSTDDQIQPFTPIAFGSEYIIKVNDKALDGKHELKLGGGYVVMIQESSADEYKLSIDIVVEPNSVNMMWLIPQYVVLTLGEVMFSVTGLEFSFTQAPTSMKSVLGSFWLMTVAFGNLIVVIVAEAKIFESQAYEYLLFAGLMFLDMMIFMLMAMRYKYVDPAIFGEGVTKEIEQNGNDIPLNEKKAED